MSEGTAPTIAELERAFTRVCLEREPPKADLDTLHDDPERWKLYRHMVRFRLREMIRSGLPKTAAVLGEPMFEDAVAGYLADHGPRSRFIREVVHELLAHTLPAWEVDPTLPSHLPDLARFEALKWRVASLPGEPTDGTHPEFDFERPPVWNRTVRTLDLHHRVDKSSESPEVLEEPHLALIYRKPGNPRISTYVLNPIGALLFVAWREASEEGTSCADGVRRVLADLGREPDARFIDGMAGVLADLVEQDLILGSA
ncbi:MAG: putative DNA-binding domain-containing protein [Sandaracinaceae bacterium]